MIETRWTYENHQGLIKWYGQVEYYGDYIAGQWFVLDATSGRLLWSHHFNRPNTVCDVCDDVIIATETRSDGPWTLCFGIYAIDAKTGILLWVNHGSGIWGGLWKFLDSIPRFTNDLRDSPTKVTGSVVFTQHKRILDLRTGAPVSSVEIDVQETPMTAAMDLYDKQGMHIGSHRIVVEDVIQDSFEDFLIYRVDENGRQVWRFSASEHSAYVAGNYFSYRLHGESIYIILGNAPRYVPIDPAEPMVVKTNPADYQLGVLDLQSGVCLIYPLENALKRTDCRIEDIHDSRLLVSCDGVCLTEYEITT